ncbi:MAG: hypothetical protein E7404_04580 [Ruminococcaceae bacterium]|nr:hypothetical protein [Oscillospiraceae bacterium]
MKKHSNSGVITLEACVVVVSFLILMLLLSSLFLIFMAQNITSHVVLQATQSLATEVYSIDKLLLESSADATNVGDFLGDLIRDLSNVDTDAREDKTNFNFEAKWYEQDDVSEAVKSRFVGYLNGGNEEEASSFLKNLNIVNGLDGLDFSGSYVENDTLYVNLKYEMEYDFQPANMENIKVEQTACSKLWKTK